MTNNKEQIKILLKHFSDWNKDSGLRFIETSYLGSPLFSKPMVDEIFKEMSIEIPDSRILKSFKDTNDKRAFLDAKEKIKNWSFNQENLKYFAYLLNESPTEKRFELFVEFINSLNKGLENQELCNQASDLFISKINNNMKNTVYKLLLDQEKKVIEYLTKKEYFSSFFKENYVNLIQKNKFFVGNLNEDVLKIADNMVSFNYTKMTISSDKERQSNFLKIMSDFQEKNFFTLCASLLIITENKVFLELMKRATNINPELKNKYSVSLKTIFTTELDAKAKIDLISYLNYDFPKISGEALASIKGKKNFELMKFFIENNADVTKDLNNVNWDLIPPERHKFVRTKKVVDIWMSSITDNPQIKNDLEKIILNQHVKKESVKLNEKKIKML